MYRPNIDLIWLTKLLPAQVEKSVRYVTACVYVHVRAFLDLHVHMTSDLDMWHVGST